MQELAARFAERPPGAAGLEVTGGLEMQLGRLAAVYEAEHQGRARRRAELSAAIFPFDFAPTAIAGPGTIDSPMVLGARDGFCMDITILVAAGFTAGSVSVYKGGVADHLLRGVFSSAGTLKFGGASLLLMPGERLLFVGTGITGNLTISGSAIMVAHSFLAEYLL